MCSTRFIKRRVRKGVGMIIPCGHRVLVKVKRYISHDPVMESAKRAGLELILDRNTRYDASVDKGEIVAVGTTAWQDFGGPWADIGDTVVYAKNAGKLVEDPEDKDNPEYQYFLLNDEDVVAIVKG